MMTSLHDNIRQGKVGQVKGFLLTKSSSRHLFNDERESAPAIALKNNQIEIYELLISKGICFGVHEDLEEIVKNFSASDKKRIRQIHKKFAKDPILSYLRKLVKHSKLIHDTSESERRTCHMKIIHALEDLNEIEGIEPILKIVACAKNLVMFYDFNRTSVEQMDPAANKQTQGICYPKASEIYIGAMEFFDVDNHYEALGVMAHELCHYAINLLYSNNCKPYSELDDKRRQAFQQILEKCCAMKDLEPIIDVVFEYSKDHQIAELIVRVPHLLVCYREKEQKLKFVQETFGELFSFFEHNTLVDLNQQLPLMEAMEKINEENDLFSTLRKSEAMLEKPFDWNLIEGNKSVILLSNCESATINAIYHITKNVFNHQLKFLFVKLEDFDDDIKLKLLIKAYSLLMLSKVIVGCDEQSQKRFVEIVSKLYKDGFNSRMVFVANQSMSEGKLTSQINSIRVTHVLADFSSDFKNQFMRYEIIFQGYKMKFEDLQDTLPDDFIPLKQVIGKQNTRIGKDISFDDIEFYIERNWVDENQCNDTISISKLMNIAGKHQTIMIFDEPGMGKSTEMKMMAKRLKEKFKTHWIVFMDLKLHFESYEKDGKVKLKFDDIDVIKSFFISKILKLDMFEATVFEKLFQSNRVIILMDGFDEICPCFKDFITNLVEGLQTQTKNKLWIASRPHLKNDLQKTTSLSAFSLKPLSIEQRHKFFLKFCEVKQIKEDQVGKLLHSMTRFFSSLEICHGYHKQEEIVCNPLLMRMLADILEGNPDADTDHLNAFSVYDQFTKKMIEKCMDKGPEAKQFFHNCHGMSKEFYAMNAIKVIMDKHPNTLKVMDRYFKKTFVPSKDDIIRTGLMYSDGEAYHFIHRTFAEFYVAQFIYEKLFLKITRVEKNLEVIMKVFIRVCWKSELKVGKFLNDALQSQKLVEPENVNNVAHIFFKTHKNRDFIHMLVQNDHINIVKACLHLCKKSSQRLLLLHENAFGAKALHYAMVSKNVESFSLVMSLYSEVFASQEIKDTFMTNLGKENIYYFFCNHSPLKQKEPKNVPSIKKITFKKRKILFNSFGENVLMVALSFLSKSSLEFIFDALFEKLGKTKCEELFSCVQENGETIFHYAIKNRDIEVFKMTVEKSIETLGREKLIEILTEVDKIKNIFAYAVKHSKNSFNLVIFICDTLGLDNTTKLLFHEKILGFSEFFISTTEAKSKFLIWSWVERICYQKEQRAFFLLRDYKGLSVFNYSVHNSEYFEKSSATLLSLFSKEEVKTNFILSSSKRLNAILLLLQWKMITYQRDNFKILWDFIVELFKGDEMRLKSMLLEADSSGQTVPTRVRYLKLDDVCPDFFMFIEKHFTKEEQISITKPCRIKKERPSGKFSLKEFLEFSTDEFSLKEFLEFSKE